MQTMMPRRCSTCQRLIDEAEAKAIAMAEGLSPSALDQPAVGLLVESAGIPNGCGSHDDASALDRGPGTDAARPGVVGAT